MDITETDEYYVVSFFPNATEVEIDEKPEKGYKAIIGTQGDEHVVMKVMYAKNMYDLNRVIELAGNITECPVCQRLNADVGKIGSIQLQDQYTTRRAQNIPALPETQSKIFDTGNPFQDVMAKMLFDTKLNQTGQVAVALALDDSELIEKVMPTSIDGVVNLVANFTELSQGKGSIYRSPEEVTAFVKALREGAKTGDEKTAEKKTTPVFRRASTIIVS